MYFENDIAVLETKTRKFELAIREFGGETMDYQAVRKKYTLYTRGAGIVAIILILCVAVVISDRLLQTVGVLVIFAGLLLGI